MVVDQGVYPTVDEWVAAWDDADLPALVQRYGICDLDEPHDPHVFTTMLFTTHTSGWSCPGQYVYCRNCDDVLCMACRLGEIHETCVYDCPSCCPDAS